MYWCSRSCISFVVCQLLLRVFVRSLPNHFWRTTWAFVNVYKVWVHKMQFSLLNTNVSKSFMHVLLTSMSHFMWWPNSPLPYPKDRTVCTVSVHLMLPLISSNSHMLWWLVTHLFVYPMFWSHRRSPEACHQTHRETTCPWSLHIHTGQPAGPCQSWALPQGHSTSPTQL
jgi:hypothetical protein